MEDPNEEEWRIQEFRPPDKRRGIWQICKCGVHLGKKMVVTGILVSAAPLALPPLVLVSALAFAFSLPSGFYIATRAATDKIMAALLPKPPQSHMLMIHSQDYNTDFKVEEDGYEEDCDLEEEDEELFEDDTSSGFTTNFDLDDHTDQLVAPHPWTIDEDTGEQVVVDKEEPFPSLPSEMVHFGDDELEELTNDTMIGIIESVEDEGVNITVEKEEPSLSIPSDMKGFPEAEEGPNRIEAALVSDELGGENDIDIEQMEQVVVHESMLELDSAGVLSTEFEREVNGMIDNEHSPEATARISSEILKGIKEAEEDMSSGENQGVEDMLEAVVVSAEVGGDSDTVIEQVDVFSSPVGTGDSRSKVKFGDVDPEELRRETTGAIESIRDEGLSETQNPQLLQEKQESDDIELEGLSIANEGTSEASSYEPEASSLSIVNERNKDSDRFLELGSNSHLSGERTQTVSQQLMALPVQQTVEQEEENSVVPPTGQMEQVVVVHESMLELDSGGVLSTEFGREVNGMIDNEHSPEKVEASTSISSEILKGIKDADEDMSFVENQRVEDMLGNDVVEAVVFSAEVGGENDTVVERVDVFSSRVGTEDSRPKVKFGDVDPEELRRESTGTIESIRDEGLSETKNPQLLQEKEEPPPCAIVRESDDVELEVSSIANEGTSETSCYEPEASSLSIPNARNKDSGRILESGSNSHPLGERTQTLSQQLMALPVQQTVEQEEENRGTGHDVVRARKLVVHVSNSGDSKARSISRARGETLILRAGISTGISSCGVQDAYLLDDATSKPIEGTYNEARIWKQMNALRTIVGYEAPPHSSCVEELKALYVFTGVEPPASFNELEDVHEKLMLLMAVVGVKE